MTVSMSGMDKTTTTTPGLVVVHADTTDQQNDFSGTKSIAYSNKKRLVVALSTVLIVAVVIAGILIGVKFFLDSTNQLVQRSYEFKFGGKTVEQNVTADSSENYVEYHLQDSDKEVWIVNDFNRDLQMTKVKRQQKTVCYIKQLNRSESAQPTDFDGDTEQQTSSNNGSVTHVYHAAESAISDSGILGTHAKTLCSGTDIFWLTKSCDVDGDSSGEPSRVRRETESGLSVNNRQKRKAAALIVVIEITYRDGSRLTIVLVFM